MIHKYVVFNLDTQQGYVVSGKTRARVERRLGPAVMDRCTVHLASARDLSLVKAGTYSPPGWRRPVSETLLRMRRRG